MLNIKGYREAAGMTQNALAEKVGVDRTAVVKWESGAAFPSSAKLPRIAEILGCTVSDLFSGEDGADEVRHRT